MLNYPLEKTTWIGKGPLKKNKWVKSRRAKKTPKELQELLEEPRKRRRNCK